MRKREGFKGQRTIIIPEFIINEIRSDPIGRQLYLTDIGYYPNALHHHRVRKSGSQQYILLYCTEGNGWISIEGKRTGIAANQYFIIPAGSPHSYGSDEKDSWSIYWLHFSGELATQFADISGNATSISLSKISRLEDRIQLFEEMVQNLEMGYSKANIHYANICLWHFLASFKYISQFRQIRKTGELNVVEQSIVYMREKLMNKISLEELATEARLSSSHFSLIFRNKTGRSPIDYLMQLRIQKACQLLDHTELRVNEIASKVGYEDPYYFSRVFKLVMNTSPTSYRNTQKG